MLSIFKGISKKKGLPPGTLVPVLKENQNNQEKPFVSIISYNDSQYTENRCFAKSELETALQNLDQNMNHWIAVMGLENIEPLQIIGQRFTLHSLLLEDVLNQFQRPKTEEYDHHLFIVSKQFQIMPENKIYLPYHISLVHGSNYVVSLHEWINEKMIANISKRIQLPNGKFRGQKTDYLIYALLDYLVDDLFSMVENYGSWLEQLENNILLNPAHHTVHDVHDIKKEILFLRKSIIPIKDMLQELLRSQNKLISKTTKRYFMDVYDHLLQIIDSMDLYKEMVSGFFETFVSQQNNKINEVMKVLTLISTIFIPLTFIAGVYGMNIKDMPELTWKYFYPHFFWIFIAVVTGVMILFFKKRKWF